MPISDSLYCLGDPDQAETHFREAVSLEPEFAVAWYNLGYVLGDLSRHEDAAEALCRAVEIEPAYADAYFNLALCLEELGEKEKAISCWQEYLKLDPAGEWADIARDAPDDPVIQDTGRATKIIFDYYKKY